MPSLMKWPDICSCFFISLWKTECMVAKTRRCFRIVPLGIEGWKNFQATPKIRILVLLGILSKFPMTNPVHDARFKLIATYFMGVETDDIYSLQILIRVRDKLHVTSVTRSGIGIRRPQMVTSRLYTDYNTLYTSFSYASFAAHMM